MRKLQILLLSALAVFSCRPVAPEKSSAPPASYLELVSAYEAGSEYIGITHLTGSAKVFFLGGGSVLVPRSEMDIEDCSGDNAPREVKFDETLSRWTVGSVRTEVGISNGEVRDALPVYAWSDEKCLCIHADNGEALVFDNVAYQEPLAPDEPAVPNNPDVPYEIPSIHIWTENEARIESKDEYVQGSIRVDDPSCAFSDRAVFEAPMKIKGRGNSTWGMPKKPYKIKFEEKHSILGIPKDKEWVLLANYADKSLLRNSVAMEVSRLLGFSWTPKMISVELWLNDEYQGVYTFTEHKKVSPDRVAIDTEKDAFYLEFENEDVDEHFWFKTSRYGVTLMCHDPQYLSEEQKATLRKYLEDFESTLYALGHDDRGPKNYADYIDVDSFVDYYILEELAKNPDGNFRKSTFLTKEKGKKLEIYHVWDFDISYGNCNYWGDGLLPRDFLLKDCVWYTRLFNKDRVWVDAVKKRWKEAYPRLETIPDFIDAQVRLLNGSQDRNFERWPILGKYVWPNAVWYKTYGEEIDYLKDFYTERLFWLDAEIEKL